MNWWRCILLFLAITDLNGTGYAQINLTLKSLESEDPVAAGFYLKKINPSLERDLLEAEIAFLNNDFSLLDSTLSRIDKVRLSKCKALQQITLRGLLAYKRNRFAEAQNIFNQAKELSSTCNDPYYQAAYVNYWSGYVSLELGDLSSAQQELSNAIKFFQTDTTRFRVKLAHSYFWLGALKLKQEQYEASITHLNLSLAIYQNLPLDKSDIQSKIYNNLGAAHNGLWNYNEAIRAYKQALSLNIAKRAAPEELAIVYSNLGRFYELYENFIQSKEYYDKAIHYLNDGNLSPDRKALIYQNYGTVLSKQYLYVPAQNQYLIALKIIEPYKEIYGNIYARILINIAYSFLNQESYTAAERWEKELDEFFKSHGNKFSEQLQEWQLYQAIRDQLLGDYKGALTLLDVLEKNTPQDDQHLKILQVKASVLKKLNSQEESQAKYRQLINHYLTKLPVTHPQIIQLYNELASTFAGTPYEKDSSIFYYTLARKNNLLINPLNKESAFYASKVEWIISNYYLLKIALTSFKANDGDFKELLKAEGLIQSSVSVIQSQRVEMRESADVINLMRLYHEFFDLAMEYYYTAYTHSADKSYLDKAFLISEKTKYQSLLASMKLDKVNAFSRVTDKVLSEERKLTTEVAQLEYQYSQEVAKQSEPLPQLLDEYLTQWKNTTSKFDHFLDSIKLNLPDYYNLKFNKTSVEVSQIQNDFLSKYPHMAWVSFYQGEQFSYALLISSNEKHFLKLGNSQTISRQLNALKNSTNLQLTEEFHQASEALYMTTFKAIDSCLLLLPQKITDLVVIPDGNLSLLNFELLGKRNKTVWSPILLRYTFSYGYSSSLLWIEFREKQSINLSKLNMIAFAPEFKSGTDTQKGRRSLENENLYEDFDFQPLEKNQDEVVKSSEVLKKHKVNSKLYLGETANEANFKKESLSSYDIIHLATHGFAGDGLPGVAFARSSESDDDDILFMEEIFALRNKARLLCLSACETAVGKISTGEGIIGLTRAFLYSGSQNIIVSLWKVNDEKTEKLMVEFYARLAKTRSISKSLHQAKVSMIKKDPALHPAHWAAFIHIGLD
ncbi:MAG: Tetratricopeptide TPR_1 repeat-containing protein [Bacteroidetes bacterium OLB12]|nr:MAG: Tetratricopeptide TPR_1 repeat-containing protein [Bacteroidetes bacterium OLB12]